MATNWALVTNGGTLSGTNIYGSGVSTPYDITWANQDSTAPRYSGDDTQCWVCDTADELIVTLAASSPVDTVVLWFNNGDSRVADPSVSDVDTLGATAQDYTISTWNGSSWDVQATITGNDKLTRSHTFVSVSTTQVKFAWTTDTGALLIGLQEIEVWGNTVVEAHGVATVLGYTNEGVGASAGAATVTTSTNVAVGSSTGTSTAPAVGMPGIHQGAGSVSCVSWARGKPPYAIKALPPDLVICADAFQTNAPYASASASISNVSRVADGFTFGVSKGAQTNVSGTSWALRFSFPSLAWIIGVRIYSGTSVLENRTTEPPDNAEFAVTYSFGSLATADGVTHAVVVPAPPNVFAPVPQFSGGNLNVSGGARVGVTGWVPLTGFGGADAPSPGNGLASTGVDISESLYFPPVYYEANAATRPPLAKRTLLFADSATRTAEQYTGYVDINFYSGHSSDSGTARIYEVQILFLSLSILGECLSTANATDSHLLYHVVTATPVTANATSTVFGYDAGEYVSTANITTLLSGSNLHIETWVDTANATSTAISVRPITAVSTANATSAVSQLPRVITLASTANAVATVVDTFVAVSTYVSTANAISLLVAAKRLNLVSTANATSAVSPSQGTLIELQSSAVASSVVLLKNNLMTLQSYAVASSVVSTKLLAHQILLSSADATSYVILADTVLQSVWVNPTTTALGTWSGTPFESMAEMNGEMYAAGVAGVYVLEDESGDAGAAISAELRWDLLSYNSVQRHRPGEVYLGGQAAGALNVRVSNEQGVFNYPTQLSGNTKDTNLRAKIGKGVSSRFIRIALTNPNGVHFSINEAQVEVIELARQVGGKHG